MVGIGIALLCVNIIIMIVFYRKILHNFSQSAYRNSVRGEVNKLIIDIERESDRAITVLENKLQELNHVCSEIDKHLLLVEKEQSKWLVKPTIEAQYQSKPAEQSHLDISKTRTGFLQEKRYETSHDAASNIQNTGYKKPTQVLLDVSGLSARDQVIELAKKGFSIDFIAEKVDLPVGEIALIQSMTK